MTLLRGTRELPEETMLVTSRPSVKTALQPLMRNKNTKHTEIVGFGEEEIQNYASLAFESNPEMLKSFNISIVKSMMYNPLNCSIITEVYQATSEAGRPIPHTQTQLYTEITLCMAPVKVYTFVQMIPMLKYPQMLIKFLLIAFFTNR